MGLKAKFKKLTKCDRVDTPWTTSMNERPSLERSSSQVGDPENHSIDHTVAAFSPNQQTATRNRNRSSVLIYQKSPLLAATPPQVTRALAYSHPFILPLNHLFGLLSWTTNDPWESFLVVAAFWFTILYGDAVLRWAGPLLIIVALILGMYSRRYSPLSSTTWSGEKQKHKRSSSDSQQRKSLDEILDTLQTFTNRCDVLLEPFLRLTEFLSTQSTATSATTRPALTSMFIRLLAIAPLWVGLTLPPLYIITTRRTILVIGTIGLTWHSVPARASRTILWRSKLVRYVASVMTGLDLSALLPTNTTQNLPLNSQLAKASGQKPKSTGPAVRFTFAVYENQRRWIGLGYTSSLLPHDRRPWTDGHLNACPGKDNFPLPETDHDSHMWRWVPDSDWKIDPHWTDDHDDDEKELDKEGWTFYDNKWHYPGKVDDWSRWTRRRKWIRDAELVEVPEKTKTPATSITTADFADDTPNRPTPPVKRKSWFGPRRGTNESNKSVDKSDAISVKSTSSTGTNRRSRDHPDDDIAYSHNRYSESQYDRSIGEGIMEGLG